MDQTLDMDTIQIMNFFENSTKARLKDCLVKNGNIYFVTYENQAQFAIGRNGSTIKSMERALGKSIRVFEYSEDLKTFVKNLVPKANDVNINNNDGETTVDIKVNRIDRSFVIGRDGKNLNLIKEILQRNMNVKNVLVK
ncbi:MAG TPA: NusA-like transcription termination signal-binding factor [archaeon]|nr:NusA-like transcription termination signal-binding factor [archaeon]